MELEVMKKLIRKYEPGHTRFSLRAMQAERYYRNETDILVKVKSEGEKKKEDSDNPLRNADNRIPPELPRAYRKSESRVYVHSTTALRHRQ